MTATDTTPPAPETTPPLDPAALEAFMGHVGMHAGAAVNGLLVALGDQLGLWKAMAGAGPLTAAEVATRAGIAPRYAQEWLAAQAANGFLAYDPAGDTFLLSPEAAMVLADEDSPALMIAAFQGMAVVARLLPTLEAAFRSGDGIAWSDREVEFFDVQERFSRPLHRQFLVDAWLAAVPGLLDRLANGAKVADIGCGYGTSALLLAERFPASQLTGFDFHDHSIARARLAARQAGVADRVTFEIAGAADFPGAGYDLVLFTDSLHDLGDPVAAARHAKGALADDGIVVTLDPAAGDSLAANLANPAAGIMYAVSTFLCTPTALAQPGGHALGAMAGSAAITKVLHDAGFTQVDQVADGPMNMVLVARP
jgi:2-polyprenyl-3-methyl-5-hydroxy-6-metoxy-1,4-benzoquinol methylase